MDCRRGCGCRGTPAACRRQPPRTSHASFGLQTRHGHASSALRSVYPPARASQQRRAWMEAPRSKALFGNARVLRSRGGRLRRSLCPGLPLARAAPRRGRAVAGTSLYEPLHASISSEDGATLIRNAKAIAPPPPPPVPAGGQKVRKDVNKDQQRALSSWQGDQQWQGH
jgi:hypothetical protein